jgi:hypothetical protein
MSKLDQLRDPRVVTALQRYCMSKSLGVAFSSHKNHGANINFGIPGTAEGGTAKWCREPWAADVCAVTVLPRPGGYDGQAN